MKKPDALVQLLEELQVEENRLTVQTVKTSKAVIFLNNDAAEAEDAIELNATECELVFDNAAAVDRLVEALGSTEASLALFDLTVSVHVLEQLENRFVTVDEG